MPRNLGSLFARALYARILERALYRDQRETARWEGPISERTGVPKLHIAKRGRLGDATLPV